MMYQYPIGYGGMMNMMFMGGMGLFWILLIIGGSLVFLSVIKNQNSSNDRKQNGQAYEELKLKYVRGEINEEEFNKMSKVIKV